MRDSRHGTAQATQKRTLNLQVGRGLLAAAGDSIDGLSDGPPDPRADRIEPRCLKEQPGNRREGLTRHLNLWVIERVCDARKLDSDRIAIRHIRARAGAFQRVSPYASPSKSALMA